MRHEASAVIITNDPCPSCSMEIFRCFHRTFSCTLGLGATTYEAAEELRRRLSSQRDTVVDHWHRNELEEAIADVQAFLSQNF